MVSLRLSGLVPAILGLSAAVAAANPPNPDRSLGPIAQRYERIAKRIVSSVLADNDAMSKMHQLCDGIGHRLSGSKALEQAVLWAAKAMRRDGQENVRLESVTVPHWVRGAESVVMVEPRIYELPMLGLGGSVGTPAGGITADVLCVKDKDELDARQAEAKGKIVVFNYPMPPYDPERGAGYGDTVQYRSNGARWASEYGAVAALVRSVTAHSLRSPHTGAMRYGDAKVRIPTAAITIEDAEMLSRMQAGGMTPRVTLKMSAKDLGTAESANVIGELRGRELPEEIVVIGGHIDSWDVGQGAHDDAAGCVMAMEAINALRKLKLIPRRTIRVVLWTNEENGLAGGKAYAKQHEKELANHVAAIESDSGAFRPKGYSLECADEARQSVAVEQMRDILGLLGDIGQLEARTGGSGADISPMRKSGVVLLGHSVENATYFDYHHTHADTLDKVDPVELSQNVAVMATVAYILADMPGRLGDQP